MTETLGKVFKQPFYLLITGGVGLSVFSLAVWLPNFPLLKTVLLSQTASVIEKISFALGLYGSILTNFTFVSATYTVLIAVLFGMYTSLFVFYVRAKRANVNSVQSVGWLGIGGVISGFLGVGCAACGTFLLTSLITLSGSGVLLFLPLGGKEFGFLGVGLLSYSVYSLVRKIAQPNVC